MFHLTSKRYGFTLVEIMVVISVIVFLVGATLTVSATIFGQARRSQTERTLRLLDLATRDWQTAADRQLTWWNDLPLNDPQAQWGQRDLHGDTEDILLVSELLEVIGRVDSARQMIEQIEPEALHRYEKGEYPAWLPSPAEKQQMDERFDGALTVLDAWGMPIYATHPGRPWTPADGDHPARDPDGTIRTYNELVYGVARGGRIAFVSAGPDRRWGSMLLPPDAPGFEQATDNLYSYPVDRPAPF